MEIGNLTVFAEEKAADRPPFAVSVPDRWAGRVRKPLAGAAAVVMNIVWKVPVPADNSRF
jgi:hypothetical protein